MAGGVCGVVALKDANAAGGKKETKLREKTSPDSFLMVFNSVSKDAEILSNRASAPCTCGLLATTGVGNQTVQYWRAFWHECQRLLELQYTPFVVARSGRPSDGHSFTRSRHSAALSFRDPGAREPSLTGRASENGRGVSGGRWTASFV